MAKLIRILIAIVFISGLVLIARNEAVRAATTAAGSDQVSALADDDCDKQINKDRPRCQDQNKDKDKCKKNKDKCGSVQPPPNAIFITESGAYSVGGFCTYTVEFLEPGLSVRVALERPLPRSLPDDVHKVRQGCRVTYYQNGKRIDEFAPELGTSRICFAATPDKSNKIYLYNVYSSSPLWGPTSETDVQSGVACSDAGPSAVYVDTFQNP